MAEITSGGLLSSLRVLELGHCIAASFTARLPGDLGADVIKVEPPGGDSMRDEGSKSVSYKTTEFSDEQAH